MNFSRGESLLMIRGSKKLPPKTDSQIDRNYVHSLLQRNVTESSEFQNASLTALTRKVEKTCGVPWSVISKQPQQQEIPLQICAQVTTHWRVKFCR